MRLLKDNKRYCFVMDMEVRDYELDCEQIVNNANYLHYMEHTRHKFCSDAGLSFIEMHNHGMDAVVRKIEIEYKTSLRGGKVSLAVFGWRGKARALFSIKTSSSLMEKSWLKEW